MKGAIVKVGCKELEILKRCSEESKWLSEIETVWISLLSSLGNHICNVNVVCERPLMITKLLKNFLPELKILTQMLFRDSDTQRRDTSYDNLSNIDIQYNFQGPFFSPPNSLVFNHLLKKDVTFYIHPF